MKNLTLQFEHYRLAHTCCQVYCRSNRSFFSFLYSQHQQPDQVTLVTTIAITTFSIDGDKWCHLFFDCGDLTDESECGECTDKHLAISQIVFMIYFLMHYTSKFFRKCHFKRLHVQYRPRAYCCQFE